jgi:hypothetical protein
MNDSFRVRCIQAVGDPDRQVKNLIHVERLLLNAMLERLACEEFHRDKVLAFMLVDVMDGADVGMIDGGGGASFPLESVQRMTVFGKLLRQKL